jgi:hypothetical protein
MKTSVITLTKAELAGTILIAMWIIASFLVPLPPVNSLGY